MSRFEDKLAAVRENPNLMLNIVMDDLESQVKGTGDYDVPDVNSPYVHLMTASMKAASMALAEDRVSLRMQYPSVALTMEDLYPHMSDDDYLGRFATPALTPWEFYLSRDEVLNKVVPYGEGGGRKLVIPRLTEFNIAGTVFTMQYPVEIRVAGHGAISVVYDVTDVSPLQSLSTNLVPTKTVTTRAGDLLLLTLEVLQMKVTTYTETLNNTSVFDESYRIDNQFYYARIYIKENGRWTEIKTTHSDFVYNPNDLTAVLKVEGQTLHVSLPTIYNTIGKVNGELRIDIYTTKGQIDLDLGSFGIADINFNTIDDDATYTAPLNSFSQLSALNPNRVNGGSNGISFDDMRKAVIHNTAGPVNKPIINSQISAAIERKGYTLVTNIDNLTDIQFLASRRLPDPVNANVISSAGTLMCQLQVSLEQISESAHTCDNGDRVTILPSQLYRYTNGKVSMYSDAEIDRVRNSGSEAITRWVVENRSLYSPFHYVLDASNNNFDVRPYYLDKPSIVRKLFIAENETTQLQAFVDSYDIERIAAGWRITVKLKSGDRFKLIDDDLVVVQLGYQPIGENNYASMNGTLIGVEDGERVYQFDIETNYDIGSNHGLYTTNLSMFDATQVSFAFNLEHDLYVSVIVNDSITPGYEASDLDLLVQSHLLDTTYMVIGREALSCVFGYDMTQLWHRNRTVLSENSYQRYEANVPAVYRETIYERDANGQIIIAVGPDGELQYKVLHRKDDPVLDENGAPVYQYLKGDTKLVDGKPVLVEARKIMREFTLFTVDGLYYFATEDGSVSYRDSIPLEIRSWIESDINLITRELLSKAKLFVYPTSTFGDTTAIVRENMRSAISIDQGLTVTYYMPEKSYKNGSLLQALSRSTKQLINQMLGNSTISTSDLITSLKQNAGEDVISVEVTGLGGAERNFSVLTLEDPATKLSMRKKLTSLPNQDLMVEDDIVINFRVHDSGM